MKTLQTALVTAAAIAAVAVGLSAPNANAADTRAYVQVDLGRGNDRGYDRDDRFDRGDRFGGGYSLDRRIDQLQARIDMGVRSRQLSSREADRLYDRLRNIERAKRSYERSGRGLDGREVALLNDNLDRLQSDIRFQGRDGNRW